MPKGIYKKTEEHKRKISLSLIGKPLSEEHKRKISENKERAKKISVALKGKKQPKKLIEKRSVAMKKYWDNNKFSKKVIERNKKISISNQGKPKSKGHKKKMSKELIKRWKNPKYKENQTRCILNGLMKRPTKYEKRIAELCVEHSLPFIYSGDGRFLINFKNPDFVNEKEKVVIEVFYSWFKIRDYGSVENYKEFCRKKYNPLGWRVIFIDENEIDVANWKELCLNKIYSIMELGKKVLGGLK